MVIEKSTTAPKQKKTNFRLVSIFCPSFSAMVKFENQRKSEISGGGDITMTIFLKLGKLKNDA